MFLRLESIAKSFDGNQVLRDISFEVEKGSITSLIGPSGVGKTTLLRILAGLDTVDSGSLLFDRTPTKECPVILVFQDYLLFPAMTVFDNVAFGLKARKLDKGEINQLVMEYLDHFQLVDKRDDYPATLSAGQRQRVAIARAMVVSPGLLLLDEPFANLDQNLKTQTAEFIRDTQKTFGVTTIAVTHDQSEAFLMSDTIGVMLGGTLAQFAPAREVSLEPATLEVAKFLGPVNVLPGQLAEKLGVEIKDDRWYIRPERLRVVVTPDGPYCVSETTVTGHALKITVNADGTAITAFTTEKISEGDRVDLALNSF